jgi:hypothetical protein
LPAPATCTRSSIEASSEPKTKDAWNRTHNNSSSQASMPTHTHASKWATCFNTKDYCVCFIIS